MSGRLEPAALSDVDRRVLASLCALDDGGEPVVGASVIERLDLDASSIYRAIRRLVEGGWVDGEVRRGAASPLRIVARPAGIARRYAYVQTLATFSNRHRDDKPDMRDCLTCGGSFASDGWGNRRCKPCLKATVEQDASWMPGAAP